MLRSRNRPGCLLAGLLAAGLLVGCGSASPTATPPPTATPLPTATAAAAPRGPAAGSPILPGRPTGTIGLFQPPNGSPVLPGGPPGTPGILHPPTGTAVLPGGPPTPTALSPGAVAANADGSCPADHPIKAVRLGQTYHSPDQASYARVRAEECFATAADAEAAGFRAAPR
ncbi:MAG TPA: hypothetical protein VFL91_11585 [Thermomicrobiales bacterium]|nr:hypothetical protein [Thermomicrobiales bacterium]